ncbi:MAG: hypothetical protein FWE13_01525 [Firmicutes bacterium]|nr:hypothetical protein [Bacillota bacterium]
MTKFSEKLINEYKEVLGKKGYPKLKDIDFSWVQKWTEANENDEFIPPTVPFVGYNYTEGGVLIYASAENLSNKGTHLECIRSSDNIYNRHRYAFRKFFDKEKRVWCQPICDGKLTIAGAYICKKRSIKNLSYKSPNDFLNNIAFGNFGKFSIDENGNGKNKDYASRLKFLEHSLDYVKKDICTLRPNLIIMPKTIYGLKTISKWLKNLLDEIGLTETEIITIYQINTQTINLFFNNKNISINDEVVNIGELENWLIEYGIKKDWYNPIFRYLNERI